MPSGTKLTGLTGAQAAQLCSDLDTYFSHVFFPELCNGLATSSINGLETAYYDLIANPNATDAQLRADCTAASRDAGASDCLGQNFDAGVQNCDVSSIPATCQATVGDYAKCLNDTTAATVQFYATVPSCNTITAASLNAYFAADGGLNDGPSEPASCSMFDSTCSADGGTSPTGKMRSAVLHRRTR